MIVSIHQPNFLPFVGYFSKMKNSDIFILLDDCQYEKNDFTNRNKIKTASGEQWITLPVDQKPLHKQVKEVKLFQYPKYSEKILASIKTNYSKSKNFKIIYPELNAIMRRSYIYLIDVNYELIVWVCGKFEIKNKILFSSELKENGKSTDRLVNLVKAVGGTHYLFGGDSKNYHNEDLFYLNGIELLENQLPQPKYTQLHGEFVANLSIIDILFNYEGDYKNALK